MQKVIDGKLMALVHDDGPCANGERHTPLDDDGRCPVCDFHPDMQSKCFIPVVEKKQG